MPLSYWLLNLSPAFLLLLLAWVARRQLGSWSAPSAFFCLYWAIALIIPLILAPDFDFWSGAAWLILVFGIYLHLGTLIGFSAIRTRNDKGWFNYRFQGLKGALVIAICCGFVSSIVLVVSSGHSLAEIIKPQLIMNIGLTHARIRYSTEPSLFSALTLNIFNTFFYAGAFLSGLYLAIKPSFVSRLLAALLFFVGLLNGFLVNVRTSLIWLLVLLIVRG